MNARFYNELRKDAEWIAARANKLLARYQKKATTIVQKDIGDMATTADYAAEELIRAFVQKKYPSHGIVGEEKGAQNERSEYVWIIDPLDGTKEYVRGSCEYNCLIAIEHNGKLAVGVLRRNGTNEVYSATAGSGVWRNGKRIQVSPQSDLSRAYVGYHLPIPTQDASRHDIERHFDLLKTLTFSCYRVRPGWDDARMLAWVAQGILDAYIIPVELKNEWHDLAPGILLVQEAGGKVTHLDGSPVEPHDMSKGFLASNGRIHDQLLSLIRKEIV